ncbi:Fpg/Nei family DNA glycosylase [Nocardia bovistercoris]|uniref:DNA-(apurinic or apyrimidinic site) lyase n=1 Tax=Nocardia bovistercoris TaxID=2785916 RepID=A0A931ICT5_9NOCA|nr:Fpg/Nei family DNA glycosylase [Nocardia bovistercoris]MBH0777438.1 Fpg/Nei family DNA glycosylase [Nocardia bovistercoris]
MPEGDTVFLTAARLRRALAGKTLVRSDFRVPRYATVDLVGQRVDEVGSYGKHLFIRTAEASIHTHLKMEGVWRTYCVGERWTRPRVTARVVLTTDDTEAVGFSLGKVEVLARSEEHTAIAHLGPDLLGPDWDAAEAIRRLSRYPEQPIGLALLDQRNLAGIGNIYRSEICFLRRVHPATPVRAVPDLPALVEEAHRVLTQAATKPPWRALVYGRQRWACQRCGGPIRVRPLAETTPPSDRITQRERGIYFCPKCQPEPNTS